VSDPLERHPSFRVVRRLAVGGMGEVLLAHFAGDARVSSGLVVVKRPIPNHPRREQHDNMLREEGRIALRLRHANLVDTFGMDELEGHPLLVMEYLAGRSMAEVLGAAKRKSEPTPVPLALAVLHAAACGLHFAHTLKDGGTPLGLVHRDVSPANIFVTFDGKCKVIDFGVAKADDSEIKTSKGILKGKLGYMSPEHATGESLDPRSDMWSLGVVFWEALIADRLFGGDNPAMTLFAITQGGELTAPSKRRPDIPPEVDALCMGLLTRDRDARIASGAELVQRIEALPARLWRDVDIGGLLASRFPTEADTGKREVASLGLPLRPAPVPRGILENSLSYRPAPGPVPLLPPAHHRGQDDDGPDSGPPTTIVDGKAMLAQVQASLASGEATRAEVSDDAKTVSVSFENVAAAMRAVADDPPPSPRAPPGPAPARTPHPAAPSWGAAPAAPAPPSWGAAPAALAPPGWGAAPAAPAPPGWGAAPAAPAPPSWGAAPAAQPAPPRPAPRAPITQPPSMAAVRIPARAPASASAVAVALGTFGALALTIGLAFALATERHDAPPPFVGYSEGGADVVVARTEDVPAGIAQPFEVRLEEARLVLAPGQPRTAIAAAPLERLLRREGVFARAVQPRAFRQKLAAALPAAITLLGLLALVLALPALLVPQPLPKLLARVVGGLVVLAGGALVFEAGALGWPGRAALAEAETTPRVSFAAPPSLAGAQVPADEGPALQQALVLGRAEILRGHSREALGLLRPVGAAGAAVPMLHLLLGEAHREAGSHGLAEGHLLRYLELLPEASDRAEIEAYLKQAGG
jgi:serine/threonine protein kinase